MQAFTVTFFLCQRRMVRNVPESKLFPEKETVPSSHYQQRVQDIEVRRLGSFTGSDRCLLSCSVHTRHRRFLLFLWRGQCYQFRCLPFGLSTSPRIFTLLLRPLQHICRSRGIRVIFILGSPSDIT